MSGPNWSDIALAVLDGKAEIDALITALEAVSPDVLKADEEAAKAAFDAAFADFNVDNLKASAAAILDAVKHGGPVGGGADANLA